MSKNRHSDQNPFYFLFFLTLNWILDWQHCNAWILNVANQGPKKKHAVDPENGWPVMHDVKIKVLD